MVLNAYSEVMAVLEENAGANGRRDAMALLAVRLIRSGALLMKWEAFRHGPMVSTLWSRLNLAYRLALKAGVAQIPVRPRGDRAHDTTAEREYVRVIALHSIGLDQLDPQRLELVSRLVHYGLPRLELASAPSTTALFWVDVASGYPPVRLMHMPRDVAQPRFFSAIKAAMALEGVLDDLTEGRLPEGLSLQAQDEVVPLKSAISHVVRIWSNDAPMRRGRRHPMPGSMMVVGGFAPLLSSVHGLADNVAPRSWNIRDASTHGIGLDVPGHEIDALEIGTLVGLYAQDGDRWRVGAVRRMWRGADEAAQVGVELLGGFAFGVTVDDGLRPVRLLLLDPIKRQVPVRVVVALPGPRQDSPLFLTGHKSVVKLSPIAVCESGPDYEVRHYLCCA